MAATAKGSRASFTERFIVQLSPEQRAALDYVAEQTGWSRSEALRRFAAYGMAAFVAALDVVDHAPADVVLDALAVACGIDADAIAAAINNRKEPPWANTPTS